jgi:hypothetical protein
MAGYRLNKRVGRDNRCHLHLGDSYYAGLIKNISMGGALVHFYEPLPGLHVGDNCKLRLGEELTCEFICEVVRVEAPDVALRFIDIDTSDAACTVSQ